MTNSQPITEEPGSNAFINQCVDFNLEWIEKIFNKMGLDPEKDKNGAVRIFVVYQHMIEAEFRRKYDI